MAKKTVNFNQSGASRLPQDKPVVYRKKNQRRKDELRWGSEEGSSAGENSGTSRRWQNPRRKGSD